MDFSDAINYRQRSQTLQPIRGSSRVGSTHPKNSLLNECFNLELNLIDPERASYANVPLDPDTNVPLSHMQQAQHNHFHNRSQSQHYYHTMRNNNDPNNYCNLSNFGLNLMPTQSRHPSPILDVPTIHNHHLPQLDSITILRVCNELGNLDSPPPMPNSRDYSISRSREYGLCKIKFPQYRFVKSKFTEPGTRKTLAAGNLVTVLGPSKNDRSKFTVSNSIHFLDIPHQLTAPPQPAQAIGGSRCCNWD